MAADRVEAEHIRRPAREAAASQDRPAEECSGEGAVGEVATAYSAAFDAVIDMLGFLPTGAFLRSEFDRMVDRVAKKNLDAHGRTGVEAR